MKEQEGHGTEQNPEGHDVSLLGQQQISILESLNPLSISSTGAPCGKADLNLQSTIPPSSTRLKDLGLFWGEGGWADAH